MGGNNYLIVKEQCVPGESTSDLKDSQKPSDARVIIRAKDGSDPLHNSVIPYQIITGFTKAGLPFHLMVEVTGEPMKEQCDDVFEHVETSVLPLVNQYAMAKFNGQDVSVLKNQMTNIRGANISLTVVHGQKGQEGHVRHVSGFATGGATFFVKPVTPSNQPDTVYTAASEDFSVQVHPSQSIVGYIGVPQDIITNNKYVVTNQDKYDIGGIRSRELKPQVPWAAVSQSVPTLEAQEENVALFKSGTSRSAASSDTGSDEPLFGSFRNALCTAGISDGSFRAGAIIVGILVVCSAVLAVADYYSGDQITDLMNDWTDDHWFDGDIGKHAASGAAFPTATTIAVGVMSLFYYGGKAVSSSCGSANKLHVE